MSFIYHGVPDDMRGKYLVPLSTMRRQDSKLAAEYTKKYDGRRKKVMERRIPLLDCRWDDVVQLLPLHPQKLFDLQKELGLITEIPPYRFYKIAVADLDPDKTAVFFKTAAGEDNTETRWLKDVKLRRLQDIPDTTRAYYQTLVGTGELPFNYQFIPHIVYKGELDISKSAIITLEP